MAASEANKRASAKYNKEKREQLNLNMPKGMKEVYRTLAARHGMSLNAYILSLLERERAAESESVTQEADGNGETPS